MKDAVHAAVHRSIHVFGEGKFYGALRLRFTRPLILDTGKTPGVGWSDPTSLPRKPWRSLQPTKGKQAAKAGVWCRGEQLESGGGQ